MNNLNILRAQYPRVSDILGKQIIAEMQKIPLETLAKATLRGIKVHNYCLSHAAGYFLADVEAEYEPYVNCFIQWYEENVQKQLHNSVRLYDDSYRFTGEFDLIAQMKSGEIALIDIKATSASSKTWPVQLAAYNHLCKLNGYTVERIFNLHLKKKYGKKDEEMTVDEDTPAPFSVHAKAIDYADIESSWQVFQGALTCYDYFDRKEVK